MIMKNVAIIGAAWGDEGKGLTVDYVASQLKGEATVIRYNGSAQCGHTVVTPEGHKHIFRHFGSGTFAGLPTHYSKYAVVNPLLFKEELELFENKFNYKPKLSADPLCLVTTPYDILLNQIIENHRGKNRHGSCGSGFGETIERQKNGPSLCICDLIDTDFPTFRRLMKLIIAQWVPKRLRKLNIPNTALEIITSEKTIEDFYLAWTLSKMNVAFTPRPVPPYIFEGGQGLLLDQDHKFFPHVTRSKTGLHNIEKLCTEWDVRGVDLDVIFVSRIYTTRHGAGPLPHELKEPPYLDVRDTTNTKHKFQGELRYSYLNLDLILKAIKKELSLSKLKIQPYIMFTCMDQLDDRKIRFIYEDEVQIKMIHKIREKLRNEIPNIKFLYSYGPTRRNVYA